jgi:hypothetical protein
MMPASLKLPWQRWRSHTFRVGVLSGAMVVITASAVAAQVVTTPDAMTLANALTAEGIPVGGSAFTAIPPGGTPNAVGTSPLAGFPTAGSTFAILTNGNANLVGLPAGSAASANNGGGEVAGRGSARDVSTLRVDFVVPEGMNCVAFQFKFFSEHTPNATIGTNDGFIAELDSTTWNSVSGGAINPGNNFALNQNGQMISLRTGVNTMSAANAAGTVYNFATPVLEAQTPAAPGPHVLYLSIFDVGSNTTDSAVFVDNLAPTFATSADACRASSGVRSTSVTASPQTDTNNVGTGHTITGRLAGTAPLGGQPMLFQVTGANPGVFTTVTDAAGAVSLTYTGANLGLDTIRVCHNLNGNAVCDPTEATRTVQKTWSAVPLPIINLSPPTDTNDVGTNHTVNATLTTATGTAISGGRILFDVSGANTLTGTILTNTAGQASFSYLGTGDGDDDILACYSVDGDDVCDPGEVTASATKTWEVGPATLAVEPPAATNLIGTMHVVTARLTTITGSVPVNNAAILFTVTGPNATDGEAFTDGGMAEFDYFGTAIGTDTIVACFDENLDGGCGADEISVTATKTWTALPATLTIAPPSATVPAGSTHTVTTTLTTGGGLTPVDNAPILFTVTGPNATDGVALTDENGQAVFNYVGTAPGADTITACFDDNLDGVCGGDEPTITATVTWTEPGSPPGQLPVTGAAPIPLAGWGVLMLLSGTAVLVVVPSISRWRRRKLGRR